MDAEDRRPSSATGIVAGGHGRERSEETVLGSFALQFQGGSNQSAA